MKQISIVGIGMGNKETLTLEGKRCIEQAEVLIGAKRMVEAVNTENKSSFISFDSIRIKEYIDSCPSEKYAVLMSGDTGFYSGTGSLLPLLEEYEVKVLPGISALSYFSARLGMSWEDAYLLSRHGREENLLTAVRQHYKTFLLTDGKIGEICRKLIQAGLGNVLVYVGENLSYTEERIVKGRPEELAELDFAALSSVFILNRDYQTELEIGIPDEEFLRGSVPMTKSEVRAIAISKLKLKEDSVIYDIGAGTGSVSVEAACLAKRGRVYAIEQNEEAVDLIKQNRDKFALDNIKVVHGFAAEVMEELETPDIAFIGGSKGSMEEIFHFLFNRNKGIRIVITAITLETLGEALRLMKLYEFKEVEVVQACISRAKEAGNYHMLMGQNPVFIISGRGEKLDEN